MKEYSISDMAEDSIIIYGAGLVARAAILMIRELLGKDKIVCCAVKNLNHNPREIEGITVKEIQELKEYKDEIIVVAVKEVYQKAVMQELMKWGFNNLYVLSLDKCIEQLQEKWRGQYGTRYEAFNKRNYAEHLTVEEHVTFLSRQLKTDVLNFEVNLADHCNLNCQSCNHFSPIAEKRYLDIEEYEKDIKRLVEIVENKIGTIMLLGGEPLLHPGVESIIRITRKYVTEAEICIVTNGLLLPKMNKSFWDCCNNNKIGILVTKYPVNFDYDSIEKLAHKNNVRLTYTLDSVECKTTYKLPLDLEGRFDKYKSYAKCYHANKCVVLKDGRLYTCPIAAYVNYFNKMFGERIPEGDQNSISIYEAMNFDELEDFLKKPINMCSYCDIQGYIYDIPWRTSRREIEEWT